MKEFSNEVFLDFGNKSIAAKQRRELDKVRLLFGREYPNTVGGKSVKSADKIISYNPANPSEIVGVFQKGGVEEAEKAMKAALKSFEIWKKVPAKQRAGYLFKAAKIIRRRRLEINAWMISEVGKNYLEADADTCEAIDFLEFYGREALRYASKQPIVPVKGEKNISTYLPLGVGVVIPPWNFPFAILAGMASAAIAAGNTVIVKPSSDSPMMGRLFADIMEEAGLPSGVLNYLVASGSTAGDYLVQHPKTRFVAFTGSMEVGLHINELAAKTQPGQIWIKRVIAEMGGKDAIIVDSEADVEAAAKGVASAAFGFQGQKCSACSRAIVDQEVYQQFLALLKQELEKIEIGDPYSDAKMGPVVSQKAYKSILNYIEIGKKEGKLLHGGSVVQKNGGYYIQPTVFYDVKPSARISQEEIFGPVLAISKSKNYDDALKIANGTIFGLTGAVYSLNPDKILRAREEFFVGNLYLNRKCTGALVGAHPFGGFNMSGTDSKAGGRDYLLLFMQAQTISEKI